MSVRISTPMPTWQIPLEPLSEAAFAPFGDVVRPGAVEGGRRYFDSFRVVSPSAEPRCWISTFQPVASDALAIAQFEAHPHSAQVFVPLQPCRFVVVVAKPNAADGQPDIATSRAFIVDGAGGIIYRPGVWHAGMMVLDAAASFFVTQGMAAEGNDVIAPLVEPLVIGGASRAV